MSEPRVLPDPDLGDGSALLAAHRELVRETRRTWARAARDMGVDCGDYWWLVMSAGDILERAEVVRCEAAVVRLEAVLGRAEDTGR